MSQSQSEIPDGRGTYRLIGSGMTECNDAQMSGDDYSDQSPPRIPHRLSLGAGDGGFDIRRNDGSSAQFTASSPRPAAAVRLKLVKRVLVVVIRFHRVC